MPYINPSPGDPTREIYEYDNGTRPVKADPAVIWRKLNAACTTHGTTWEAIGEQWTNLVISPEQRSMMSDADLAANTRDWLEVQGKIVEIARAAFDLPALDDEGNGVTESFVMGVLVNFIEDREKKDSSTETSPSTSAPTGGGQTVTSHPSSDAPPIMTSTTGSASIGASPSPLMPLRRSGRSGRLSASPPTPC